MKKVAFLLLVTWFTFISSALESQNLSTREIINDINTLLQANPYVDNFLEITFYYSIDVTSDNELVVNMESKENFKSTFKAKIFDLDNSYQKDFCNKASNSISWTCHSKDTVIQKRGCVYVEGTVPGGGEANYFQDNIDVMFSNRSGVCEKLYNSFNQLFIKVPGTTHSDKAEAAPENSANLFSEGKNKSTPDSLKYLYVGMVKCASTCHNNEKMGFQYDIMKNSAHSKAFNVLSSDKAVGYAKNVDIKGNPQESLVCLRCHITGAGLDSSFFASSYKKEDGVTCEACHKGAFMKKTFLPKETDCLTCHNNSVHEMPEFMFNDACLKIAHSRPKVESNAKKPISMNFESQPKTTR
jgi:hypothetical protein